MELEVPILQTYVDGLDRVLGGGIPKGSTVLVAGTPGTMKTSLILWMMHENARAHGTKSLYVSLEQDMDSLNAGAARMGMGNLHEVEVSETEVQRRLRCVKMRWMNHDHNALALHHDGEKFFVSHVISKKK